MRLQAYTHEDLFAMSVAIVRGVTGVEYPFTRRTWHRAVAEVQSIFAASANMETLRLVKGSNLEGLSGPLLERRTLESGVTKYPPQAARMVGRFIRNGATGTARSIPPSTISIRPATATQSELAFRSEAAAVIGASETDSNLLFVSCTETGEKGNAIPSAAELPLRNPIDGVAHFKAESDSAGGYSRESDASIRTRARSQRRGHGECTWSGIEYLLGTVGLSTGQKITSVRLFEAFDEPSPLYTGLTYAIIDDGSGDDTLIGAINATTYGYGTANWLEYTEASFNVYVRVEAYPFVIWEDGVNSVLQRDSGGGWVAQTLGTDYFVDNDSGKLAFAVPLTAGHKIRCQFSFYTGLIKEAAKYVNGIYQSTTVKGWRPTGYAVRIRAPFSVVKPSVSAGITFASGWDSSFGRFVATTNVLAYLNGLAIGDPARYDVLGSIIHKTPGVDYLSDLLLAGGTANVPVTHKYGVVRGTASTIVL